MTTYRSFDHTFVAGDREVITETIGDSLPSGEVDLADRSVRIAVRSQTTGDKIVDEAAEVVDAAAGTVRYEFAPEKTMQAGRYEYEWIVEDGPEDPTTLPRGSSPTIRIRDDVEGSDEVVSPIPEDQRVRTLIADGLTGSIVDGERVTDIAGANLAVDASNRLGIPDSAVASALDGESISPEEASVDDIPVTQSSDVTYYVNQANGDDENAGTSASEAFATYERAFEEVARFTESHVEIRQIGDYNGEVRLQGRLGGPQTTVRDVSVEVVGDSEIDGRGADPSNMESINGDVKIYGCVGVGFDYLHLNGRVWLQGSQNLQLGRCKLGSDGTLFVYAKGSTGSVSKCEFDPQAQDPSFGVFSSVGAVLTVGGNTTFQNWDPNANTWLFANGGVILDDEWEDGNEYKEGDVTRRGNVIPNDGFVLGAPAMDRGLRGKPISGLREVSNASAGDLTSGEWAFDDNRGGSGNGAWVFKGSDGTLYYTDFDNAGEVLLEEYASAEDAPAGSGVGIVGVTSDGHLLLEDGN